MKFINRYFITGPVQREESSGQNYRNQNDRLNERARDKGDNHHTEKEKRSKLRDTLQQWSNDDARDREEDDSTPMRSNL